MLKKRIKKLNNVENKNNGKSVVYIMSRDQRVKDNHALIAALKHAEAKELPIVVAFILYPQVRDRLLNQYQWMIEGLKKVEKDLVKLNIPFYVSVGKTVDELKKIEEKFNPQAIYFDFSPLRGPIATKSSFAKDSNSACYVVDTHNVVPIWEASNKEEYGARTIRPKIHKKLEEFLIEPESISELRIPNYKWDEIPKKFLSKHNWEDLLTEINAEELENYSPIVKPGEDEARKVLDDFIHNKLKDYAELRNDPANNFLSDLSAYFHFGQLSTLRVALEIEEYVNRAQPQMNDLNRKKLNQSKESYLEEMIVRKELSDNFCYYNKNYDNLKGGKEWAIKTLQDHSTDKREHIYSFEELERGDTHDKAWNASQKQMTRTGKMHGYMRMYWAKKILEWTQNPKTALEYCIKLNNKYELDGYDPNGFVGCMWSIVGVHDRGWTEREVFGKIRYMNFNGLKRKFDIEKYIEEWEDNK